MIPGNEKKKEESNAIPIILRKCAEPLPAITLTVIKSNVFINDAATLMVRLKATV